MKGLDAAGPGEDTDSEHRRSSKAVGIGRSLAYDLAARDEFPVRIIRCGEAPAGSDGRAARGVGARWLRGVSRGPGYSLTAVLGLPPEKGPDEERALAGAQRAALDAIFETGAAGVVAAIGDDYAVSTFTEDNAAASSCHSASRARPSSHKTCR